MHTRRQLLVLGAAVLAAPLAWAQQARRVYRIGYPVISPRKSLEHWIAALEQGLREHGYVPGKDIVIETRSAEGNIERYPEVVQEVVRSKPDVIITGNNTNTTLVKAATQSIPIVMTIGTDVIRAGYARSLAKPGGNITGITWDVGGDIVVKRLELLKEISPKISRVAVLWEPPYREQYKPAMDAAAPVIGVSMFWHEYSGNPERDVAEIARLRPDALDVQASGGIFTRRAEIIDLATKNRLPTAFPISEFVVSGALMSYGPNNAATFRAAARYVDRILKGAKPAELPIEQPTKIDLEINLKTAKALGIKVPSSIMARVDRVIE